MCRFLAYRGAPIAMDKLLYQPRNSLVRQSFKARELEEPLNGDGFGIGWYQREIDPNPAVFLSVQPAWNNANLRSIAPKISSSCFLAHVRAASHGRVSQTNSHPFHYGPFLLMHNGSIGGFRVIKRALRMRLSDSIYDWLRGETDSEHFFALFLERMSHEGGEVTCERMVEALRGAVSDLKELLDEHGITSSTFLNVVITDGDTILTTRYTTDPELTPHTLYHSEGSKFECIDGVCRMTRTDSEEHAVLVVSERLTDVKEDWHLVPANHLVTIRPDLSVTVEPIKV